MGQAQAAAQAGFGRTHLPIVRFVIHTQQMQDTVQKKDAELVAEGVAVLSGLSGGGFK